MTDLKENLLNKKHFSYYQLNGKSAFENYNEQKIAIRSMVNQEMKKRNLLADKNKKVKVELDKKSLESVKDQLDKELRDMFK